MSSKRFREASKLVDRTKTYGLDEAVALVKQTATTKFDSGVEIHANLGIDPKKADQIVRGTAQLPHGTGKKLKIAVFAKGPAAEAARKAGAHVVGDTDLIEEIKKTGRADFDIAIAMPDMMKNLAPIAKTLGTKGLMPNPKDETVTPDPANTVEALQTGKVSFRADDTGNVHQLVGRASLTPDQLKENLATFIEALKKAKPTAAKGTFIKSLTVTTSMGPGIKLAA